MNEEEISRIIKDSVKSPPENFTDELMKKISPDNKTSVNIRLSIILLSVAFIVIFGLLFTAPFPEIILFRDFIRISPIIIQVSGIFFILFEINQLHEIYRKTKEIRL